MSYNTGNRVAYRFSFNNGDSETNETDRVARTTKVISQPFNDVYTRYHQRTIREYFG